MRVTPPAPPPSRSGDDSPPSERPPQAPAPTRRDEVVEVLHGETVVDPYRWLEDAESDEVRAWAAAQTEHTEQLLASRPGYAELRARIEGFLRVGAVEPPTVVSRPDAPARYFYRRQAPTEDQPVLYVRDGQDGADRVLLDPNTKSADGTVSLDWWVPSWDGRLLAYGLSEGGDEDSTLRVLDVETGRDLPETEVITRARYASVAWLPDGSGFYYTRYPAPGSVPAGEERYHRRVFEHHLGRSADDDPVIFGEGRSLTDMAMIDISPSGRWLVASVHMGWSRRELYLRDRTRPGSAWFPLAVPARDALYHALVRDDHLLIRTNDGAPTYRVFRVDPERPDRASWREIIAPGEHVLAGVAEVGGEIVAVYIEHARSVVRRFSADGAPRGEVPLPAIGTVQAVTGAWDGREAFFDFTSFVVPMTVFRVDLETGRAGAWAEVKAPVDPSEYAVEQAFATSRDGTSIPMFLTYRRGLARDGRAPAVVTGYGGFNISQMPAWSGARIAFLERGGVTVVANLRGGGEYGEAWHKAGMLERKQNVFDDVIAVAEHLVATGITSKDRLAIAGGSNGGLLVGAAITQRPDLFRAAVCAVPLLDMIRYHLFQIARLWVPEYGSADDPEQFRWLRAYSPYHRVRDGVDYPAVLFSTAEGDTRVDPLHARKMAARLQAATRSGHPVLLRSESKAGHGAGKPISKRVDEASLVYSFLFWQLGIG